MVTNTNICHLLIIVIFFTEVSFSVMSRIIWFADCINNNKLGLKSPAHPAFDCQTIYFSEKMFMEFHAERNYILFADITWHLLSPGNKIFKRILGSVFDSHVIINTFICFVTYPSFNPLISIHYSCLHSITVRKCVFTLSSLDTNQHRL